MATALWGDKNAADDLVEQTLLEAITLVRSDVLRGPPVQLLPELLHQISRNERAGGHRRHCWKERRWPYRTT